MSFFFITSLTARKSKGVPPPTPWVGVDDETADYQHGREFLRLPQEVQLVSWTKMPAGKCWLVLCGPPPMGVEGPGVVGPVGSWAGPGWHSKPQKQTINQTQLG